MGITNFSSGKGCQKESGSPGYGTVLLPKAIFFYLIDRIGFSAIFRENEPSGIPHIDDDSSNADYYRRQISSLVSKESAESGRSLESVNDNIRHSTPIAFGGRVNRAASPSLSQIEHRRLGQSPNRRVVWADQRWRYFVLLWKKKFFKEKIYFYFSIKKICLNNISFI
jgi:hypothetical protein